MKLRTASAHDEGLTASRFGAECIRAKDAHPELSQVPRGRLLGSFRCIAGRGLVIVERPALRRIGEHRQPRGELVAGAVAARMRHA
jgi:hypothetical protein